MHNIYVRPCSFVTLTPLSPPDRSLSPHQAHYEAGRSCLCSLTHSASIRPPATFDAPPEAGPTPTSGTTTNATRKARTASATTTVAPRAGMVTSLTCQRVRAKKVSSAAALAPLKRHCDRLAAWMQATGNTTHTHASFSPLPSSCFSRFSLSPNRPLASPVYAEEDFPLALELLVVDFIHTGNPPTASPGADSSITGKGEGLLGPWRFLQVKGLQVTPACREAARFYHAQRLWRSVQGRRPSVSIAGQPPRITGAHNNDEEEEDEVEDGRAAQAHGNRRQAPPPPRQRLRPTADGAHFLFTPYLSDAELRRRLAAQVGACRVLFIAPFVAVAVDQPRSLVVMIACPVTDITL